MAQIRPVHADNFGPLVPARVWRRKVRRQLGREGVVVAPLHGGARETADRLRGAVRGKETWTTIAETAVLPDGQDELAVPGAASKPSRGRQFRSTNQGEVELAPSTVPAFD